MASDHSRLADLADEIRDLPPTESALARLHWLHQRLTHGIASLQERHDMVVALLYRSLVQDLIQRVSTEDYIDRPQLEEAVNSLLASFLAAPRFVHNDRAQRAWYEHMHRFAAAYRGLMRQSLIEGATRVADIDFLVADSDLSTLTGPADERELEDDPTLKMLPNLGQSLTNDPIRERILGWYRSETTEALASLNGRGASLCFVGRTTPSLFPSGAFTLMNYLGLEFREPALIAFQPGVGGRRMSAERPFPQPGGIAILIGDATKSGGSFFQAAKFLQAHYHQDVTTALVFYDFDIGAREGLRARNIDLRSYLRRSEIADQLRAEYLRIVSEHEKRDSIGLSIDILDDMVNNVHGMPSEKLPIPEDLSPPDIWRRRWASPALQALGRWLMEHRIPNEDASYAVENLWRFYSDYILPTYNDAVPLGVAASQVQGSEVAIYLPTLADLPSHESEEQKTTALRQAFAAELAGEVDTNDLHVTLDFIGQSPDGSTFTETFEKHATERDQQVLGLFQDDLEAELRLAISAENFASWLEQPLAALGYRKPIEMLRSPNLADQQPLRQLVFARKYIMAS